MPPILGLPIILILLVALAAGLLAMPQLFFALKAIAEYFGWYEHGANLVASAISVAVFALVTTTICAVIKIISEGLK